ncbi:DJ-1 protein [Venturia nashicola]|uniref:D-lactate dehydratase n=1 Tax=Venturia nashicola TaxID=86259 RepID=A0A4Z1NW57_9PEZI|nr:DJ-1 protein [Venturia nashicola]
MPSALILIADGTEEIEFVTPYDVLIRAGFQVTSVGINLKSQYATCTRNVKIIPDTTDLPSEPTTDILILPGGGPGAATFVASNSVQHLVRAYRDAGKHTAFICAGTTALVASVKGAGKTEGLESTKMVRVTSHPSVKKEIEDAGWDYADESERVVINGKVITSRGPGTAMEFALTIVEVLVGKEKRQEVAGPMLSPEVVKA